jgi:hypothetical protein
MKSTTRGTLAAVLTCVAAAAGAAAATPAAATETLPVPVPLNGAERALGTELPEAGGEVPLLMPGVPEAPRYVEGRLFPERTVPRIPLHAALPGAEARTPLPETLGAGSDRVGLDAPVSDLRALGPGVVLDAPLTPPNPDNFGMPDLKLPQAGLITPALQAVPTADLGAGQGR